MAGIKIRDTAPLRTAQPSPSTASASIIAKASKFFQIYSVLIYTQTEYKYLITI
jgi:hypothetical protein